MIYLIVTFWLLQPRPAEANLHPFAASNLLLHKTFKELPVYCVPKINDTINLANEGQENQKIAIPFTSTALMLSTAAIYQNHASNEAFLPAETPEYPSQFLSRSEYLEVYGIFLTPNFAVTATHYMFMSSSNCRTSLVYPWRYSAKAQDLEETALNQLQAFIKSSKMRLKVISFGLERPSPLLVLSPPAAIQATVWIADHNAIVILRLLTAARNTWSQLDGEKVKSETVTANLPCNCPDPIVVRETGLEVPQPAFIRTGTVCEGGD